MGETWKNSGVGLPTVSQVQEKWKQVKQAMQDSGMAKKLRSSTKRPDYSILGDDSDSDTRKSSKSRRTRTDQERKQMMLNMELLPRIKAMGICPLYLAEKVAGMFQAISNEELLRMMFDTQSLQIRVFEAIAALNTQVSTWV